MNPSAVSERLQLGSPKFLTLFLSIFDRSQWSHFWNFFWKFRKIERQKFSGVLEPLVKNQKIEKKIFFLQEMLLFLAKSAFYMFSAFIWGIKHFSSSKFEILTFFGLKNLIFDLRHLKARSGKSITLRRLFLVSLESQRSKYLFGIKFWVVGGLFDSSKTTLKNLGQIDPPPPGYVCTRPRPE